ncbi:hypothetical protein [Pedobacter insulae]|uniref:Uncharacterized protein n=1 Tax=Pedobacter insulae TaxID=414048 RepID=A0A1I2T9W7_9SPHI|nr:hypothetical protein [Pedobacter insulae]SFG61813.1 hypothetical protein SAMN04489864_101280 [Pedobacter insulae]
MSTLVVNINDKKSEKAIKAVLDALGLSYNIERDNSVITSEEIIYNRLKESAKQIKRHKQGKLSLKDASEILNEL